MKSMRMSNVVKRFCIMLAVLATTISCRAYAQQSSPSAPGEQPAFPMAKTNVSLRASLHEDWTSLTLEKSTLHPEPPVVGEVDEVPNSKFTRERLQLQWRPFDAFDLYIVRPTGVKKPPVILYLYSFPQDTDRFKDNVWGAAATGTGYAAVGFVSALTGHRAEHRPMKEWFVSELQESLATSTHDVQLILNYLATRGDLDMDRVGIFGQGSGGTIALLAAAADPRIKVVDVLTPWGDWPNWLANSKVVPEEERSKYTNPEFLASVAQLDPTVWLPKLKSQSVRIQNVRKDGTVPDIVQEHIEAAAPDTAQVNQFGDGSALIPQAAGGKLFDWIKEQLDSDVKPKTATELSERVHFFPSRGKSIQ